jgi:hypothetical protein
MVVLGPLAVVLVVAALAQAIRIGVVRGDWMAIKLLVGLTLAAAALALLAYTLPAGD